MVTQATQETGQKIRDATRRPVHALTAGDVMKRDPVVVPQHMLVREAARLIHRARASAAAVVDEHGRYAGMLSPADVFRWAEAGSPATAVDPTLACPYQVRGRQLNGDDAVICTLAYESCPFQARQSATGGRRTVVCERPENERPPLGTVPRYLTTDVVTVRPPMPLLEVLRQMIDARADRLAVLDDFDRPIGMVSPIEVLNAVADHPIDEGHCNVDDSITVSGPRK